jgi:hypothetical protein
MLALHIRLEKKMRTGATSVSLSNLVLGVKYELGEEKKRKREANDFTSEIKGTGYLRLLIRSFLCIPPNIMIALLVSR